MASKFTMAGITTLPSGETIYRFGNGDFTIRLGVFERSGCKDIKFFELPHEMSKTEAIAWLNAAGHFGVMPKVGRKPGSKVGRKTGASKVVVTSAQVAQEPVNNVDVADLINAVSADTNTVDADEMAGEPTPA